MLKTTLRLSLPFIPSYYKELKDKQVFFTGMIPKLDNAFAALNKGVQRVVIGKAEQLQELVTQQPAQTLQMNNTTNALTEKAIALLKQLISTPSYSKEENDTAEPLLIFLKATIFPVQVLAIISMQKMRITMKKKPSILLNSHHDTVKPNKGYTMDPFTPMVKDGKLYGLGSNDAGGCLVSLMATFLYFYNENNLATTLYLPHVQKKKSVVSMASNWYCHF